jgi:tetratricopeptide (TPR) repeat protein
LLAPALAVLAAGCDAWPWSSPGSGAPTPPAQASAPAPIDLAFSGCAVVHAGPRCELAASRRIQLWAPSGTRLSVHTQQAAVPFERTDAVQGGTRFALVVPLGARELLLRFDGDRPSARLPLLDPTSTPLLVEAAALRAQGRYAEARQRLTAGTSALTPPLQGRARALLARLALSEGDYERAADGLAASMALALEHGRVSDAVYDATALAYVSIMNLHDYARARDVLMRADAAAQYDAASQAIVPHYRGLLALETGDVRGALGEFRRAALQCERLGLSDHELLARQKEASTLALLGRHAEALQLQQQLLRRAPTDDACKTVDAHERLTWIAILAGTENRGDMAALARRASDDAAAALQRCKSPWRERNHQINAGLLALQQADVATATAAVRRLAALEGGEDALLRTWQAELRGRVELARGRAAPALEAFHEARELAERAALWDSEHLAWAGIGRALERLGRRDRAIDAYQAADRTMDRLLAGIPLGEGQAGFLREREAAAQRMIALLVERGRPAEALARARHARSRLLQSLSHALRLSRLSPEARARWESAIRRYRTLRDALERAQADSWQLPADRLTASRAELERTRSEALVALDHAHALLADGSTHAAPTLELPANAVLLAYFPAGEQVLGFAANASGVRAQVLAIAGEGAQPTAELGALLFAPFRAELAAATQVRLIADGSLSGLDVHALELDGRPLLERAPVVYTLDGPLRGEPAAAGGDALVVADPSGDLPAAEREGRSVAAVLGAASSHLLARADATRARVLSLLPGSRLFHYAGHGQYAGTEGIDSGLSLADGQLTLGDVLSLPRAPPLVVLSACEGARTEGAGFASGMSLALSFVAAGARAVVAASRPLADDTAHALLEGFYRARGADTDPAQALQRAQLALRASRPAADWASLRVIVP